jgi:hypothetical protein
MHYNNTFIDLRSTLMNFTTTGNDYFMRLAKLQQTCVHFLENDAEQSQM